MEQKNFSYEVIRTKIRDSDGYAIISQDGEVNAFYPIYIYLAEQVNKPDTVEISIDFFRHIAILQNQGAQIIFKVQ